MIIFRKIICSFSLLIFLTLSVNVWADDFHYVNMLVGDRPTGLGGAYTALSDDPAGCFYNPAGIVFAPHSSLSASVNAFSVSGKKYKDALLGTNGQRLDWEQKSSSILPNFFGIVRKLGKGVVGFSYAVTDSTQRRQDQMFSNIESLLAGNPIETYSINIDDSDKTYYFGPSYAYRFSNSFSAGATLYAYYRNKELIRNQLILFESGQHYFSNIYETQTVWGYRPSVGIVWEPYDQLSVGLSVSRIFITSSDNVNQIISRDTISDTIVQLEGEDYDFTDTDTIFYDRSLSANEDKFPLSASLGIAWFASPRLLFSGDIAYYEEVQGKESVINLFMGAEYYLSDSLALRAGFFTDHANTPSLSKNAANQSEHVDIYGADLSVTVFRGMSAITVGMSSGFGNGEAQIVANSPEIQDVEVRNLTLYVSASYSY